MQIKQDMLLITDGSGLWSSKQATIHVTGIELSYVAEGQDFGELRLFFDTNYWDTYEDGLIYTDRAFEDGMQEVLTQLGYAGHSVWYSEQGMQGDEYVSCDVGKEFIDSFRNKHPEVYTEILREFELIPDLDD